MSRKFRLFKRGQILELEITGFAFGGKGIAKVPTDEGDFTVFVQNTFPGQKVQARIVKCQARHAECKLDKVLRRSEDEIETPFQPIPGAPYATVPLALQQEKKKETTLDLFKRIGHVEDIDDKFDEFVLSPREWHYRNKMEYSFSEIRFDLDEEQEHDDFGLGFKHRGTWWSVENLDADSGIFDSDFENKLRQLRLFFEKSGLPAWHPPQRKGFYRFLVARKSFAQDQILLNLVTSSDGLDKFDQDGFLALCQEILGERLAGVVHSINDDTGERVEARAGVAKLLWGRETVVETISGLDFEISLNSFFQTNPGSAERLYEKAISYATEGTEADHVFMDLFCGTGTITQLLAKHVKSNVIGVDIVESAIANAKLSSQLNGVSNVNFIAEDAGKFLLNNPEYTGNIGTIMLDPPRAGISPKTLRKVIRLEANRIVYISCNPATQARDTEILIESGYTLKKLSLCDQFPHTSHVETIALFEK